MLSELLAKVDDLLHKQNQANETMRRLRLSLIMQYELSQKGLELSDVAYNIIGAQWPLWNKNNHVNRFKFGSYVIGCRLKDGELFTYSKPIEP